MDITNRLVILWIGWQLTCWVELEKRGMLFDIFLQLGGQSTELYVFFFSGEFLIAGEGCGGLQWDNKKTRSFAGYF